jgi:DUF4097 and DUF4098 domain-containing protein YvlB
MRTRLVVIAAIFLVVSSGISAQEVKTLKLPAEGVNTLEISCGAGFLKVHGVEGLNTIEVNAEISVRGVGQDDMKKFIENHVTLSLENKGGRAVLMSDIKERPIFSFHDARIDLTVSVPRKMNLDVDDGSGSIDIGNIIGDLYIEDGSGEMLVENIQGNLKIVDGSGEIHVREISGNVAIDDGSGSITAVRIGGSLTIDDGSGSIDVDGVEKDLILKETGSGGVHFRNIKGQVIK